MHASLKAHPKSLQCLSGYEIICHFLELLSLHLTLKHKQKIKIPG